VLTQFRILVDDFSTSFRFYRDVLGLKPQEGHPETGPYGCFKGDGTDTDIALFDRAMMAASLGLPGDRKPGAADHGRSQGHDRDRDRDRDRDYDYDHAVLVFRVDDVDAAYAEATAHGAVPAGEPKDQPGWGMRVAHIRASEGTLIEFCSYD
jgi:predicted enzyme related to lactoylglutathione lyase